MDNSYSGTKEDVMLTENALKALVEGHSIYVRIGAWDDETPAFLRISPPDKTVGEWLTETGSVGLKVEL